MHNHTLLCKFQQETNSDRAALVHYKPALLCDKQKSTICHTGLQEQLSAKPSERSQTVSNSEFELRISFGETRMT